MLYLNTKDIQSIGINWNETVSVIERTVCSIQQGAYHQPIKSYLKFVDPINRIIAMPAYVGADFNVTGIKWIASFPKNIEKGIQRAHSITILNNVNTGQPIATFNTAIVSGIRTASVSGLIIQEASKVRNLHNLKVGIVGFGPIGLLHLQMLATLFEKEISEIRLYDLRAIETDCIPENVKDRTNIVDTWEEAYEPSDLFITCTVSTKRYIDKKPKEGAILLNVSLRDFTPAIHDYNPIIIVDSWEEVCRANTDVEVLNKERGLKKEDTYSITDVICFNVLREIPTDKILYFNPMGMASFDITIAAYYYTQAVAKGIGLSLEN